MKIQWIIPCLVLVGVMLAGCGTDDNPVTPEKMQTIRKKQSDEMQQLAKGGNAPSQPPTK